MEYRFTTLRRGLLAIGVATVAATAASAQQPETPTKDVMAYGDTYEQLAFIAADRDSDGVVSEAEFVRDAAAAFTDLDANNDRRLASGELAPHDPADFAEVDADGDGFLTFTEVMRFKMQAFEAANVDNDEGLSFAEMEESVEEEVGSEQ